MAHKKTKTEIWEENERVLHHIEILEEESENRKREKKAPEDAYVSLQHINKIYPNHVQAVYDFNLDIKKNEFIVLVGPSGCGKSTTLRMVAGLETITSGNLFIDHVYSNDLMPKDRDLAMVFQSYALYPHMTVYGNMAYGLKIRKVKTLVIDEKAYSAQLKKVKTLQKQLSEELDELSLLEGQNKEESLITAQKEKVASLKESLGKEKETLATIRKTPLLGIDKDRISTLEKEKKKALKRIEALEKENGDANEIQEQKDKIKTFDEERDYLSHNKTPIYRMKHMRKDEIDTAIKEAAQILNLSDYLDRKPSTLSGGQCQRVALGRAIVRHSKLFLMDEPLSNLDAKLRVVMRNEIVKLHRRIGATTLYVTHDQVEAMTMADRIVIMNKGHVQQIGTPEEVYNHPSNLFVATFIGSPSMNILSGFYEKGKVTIGDNYSFMLPSSFIEAHDAFLKEKIQKLGLEKERLTKDIASIEESEAKKEKLPSWKSTIQKEKLESDKKALEDLNSSLEEYQRQLNGERHAIKIGIRPEDVLLEKNDKEEFSDPLSCKVDFSEILGRESYAHLDYEGQKLETKITGKALNDDSLVQVYFRLAFLHLFDLKSEENMTLSLRK